MKKIKLKLSVGTRYVGSDVKDTIDFEVEDDATPEQIENLADKIAEEWVWENIDFNYSIVS